MSFVHQNLRIADFDQLREVLQGWETEPVQLSPGSLDLAIEQASSPHVSVLRMSLSPRVSDRAVVHPGLVGFVLVESPHLWCGIELVPPAIFITREGRETRSVLEADFRSLEFYFQEEELAEHPLGTLLGTASLQPEESVFPISDIAAEQLRTVADAAFSWTDPIPGHSDSPELSFAAQFVLLDRLQSILAPHLKDCAQDRRRPKRKARFDLAVAALDEIDTTGSAQTSVSEILARLGVSRRALEQAFANTLGISPGQYLLACRLNQARNRLANEAPRVIDAATDSGFTDLSRFANQYLRLFGELPSQTLRRGEKLIRI